ncbi:carboxypeptidase-like regulatory domain-containing protein [Algoriphagus sp.]|uniref:TonB-dependent receptor n=1 Tax=Algoriphagus sp. TaxID=1872435 RepID=UPI0026303ECF|nr:carboxypeptidase-like regulatory domain-containing protein [Algoriphagus sp.]
MDRRIILYLFFFISPLLAYGQTQISGRVIDEQGEPLPGVNVFIKNSYDGATSSGDGSFEFLTSVEGDQVLIFQLMGFHQVELNIQLEGKALKTPDQIIREAITDMNAVTISAGAMEASDEKKSVILRPLDIVTTPSAMGDIVGAFQTLPGTSTLGNDGRLFVRGGDASEVGIYIDGLRVGNAYGTTAGNVPTRTRFNPNLFKGTFFSTGGYSAEYGQALSSTLALNTKDLSLRSQGDLSLMSVGGGYSHTLANEKQSLTASVNYFDLKPYQSLIKQDFDFERAPWGRDAELALQKKFSNGGIWKVLARTEAGGMKLREQPPGEQNSDQTLDLKNTYSFIQTNWRRSFESGWTIFTGAALSDNSDQVNLDSVNLNRKNFLFHSKFSAIHDFSDRLSVNSGMEYFVRRYRESRSPHNPMQSFDDGQLFAFTEWDYYLSKNWVLRSGLRWGSSSLNQETWLDPRVSLAFRLSEQSQVSLAGGSFSQLPVDNLRVLNSQLKNSESNHLILNYLLQTEGLTFRAETFYKSYEELILFEGYPQFPLNPRNGGKGFAQGVDIFFRDRKSLKNTDYWVTYSFVDSKRQFDQFQTQVQPGFAPKHNFSVVVKHFVTDLKSQIGASFSWNDGFPYTDPNLSGEMNRKTKSFQNLSVSWSYLPRQNLIIHGAISNVLGAENVFGFEYARQPNTEGRFESRAIGQTAPRFLFLGIFLTLSKDKSANQLNNL